MKKKFIIIAIMILFIIIAIKGFVYIKDNKVIECHKMKEEIVEQNEWERLKDNIKVSYSPAKNTVYISYPYGSTEAMYKLVQYMNMKLSDDSFWMNEKQCRYTMSASQVWSAIVPSINVRNYYTKDDVKYNKEGIYMYLSAGWNLKNGELFEDVLSLEIGKLYAEGDTLEDVTILKYFPNFISISKRKLILPFYDDYRKEYIGCGVYLNWRYESE